MRIPDKIIISDRIKLIITDFDGTLFDTKAVNYRAYKRALNDHGYDIDYDFFRTYCNGKHYMDFIPRIIGDDEGVLQEIHKKKKQYYADFISSVRLNEELLAILDACRIRMKIALVTTASRQNLNDVLDSFQLSDFFDFILTQEDIEKQKPDPEGFLNVMSHFDVSPEETFIFEDSDAGIEAAIRSGAGYFVVKGFN